MPAWPSPGEALSRLGLDFYYRRLPPAMPRLPGEAWRKRPFLPVLPGKGGDRFSMCVSVRVFLRYGGARSAW